MAHRADYQAQRDQDRAYGHKQRGKACSHLHQRGCQYRIFFDKPPQLVQPHAGLFRQRHQAWPQGIESPQLQLAQLDLEQIQLFLSGFHPRDPVSIDAAAGRACALLDRLHLRLVGERWPQEVEHLLVAEQLAQVERVGQAFHRSGAFLRILDRDRVLEFLRRRWTLAVHVAGDQFERALQRIDALARHAQHRLFKVDAGLVEGLDGVRRGEVA